MYMVKSSTLIGFGGTTEGSFPDPEIRLAVSEQTGCILVRWLVISFRYFATPFWTELTLFPDKIEKTRELNPTSLSPTVMPALSIIPPAINNLISSFFDCNDLSLLKITVISWNVISLKIIVFEVFHRDSIFFSPRKRSDLISDKSRILIIFFPPGMKVIHYRVLVLAQSIFL